MSPAFAIVALWAAWVISWVIAAFWSNRTEGRPDIGSQIRYRVPMIAGTMLLARPAHGYEGPLRLWHIGWTGAWISVALVAIGIAFTWWARIHLGRLWSGNITIKADHRIVDTGPYGLVRHPIYTGLILSLIGTAAAKGTVLGIGGFVLLSFGIWLKARLEERWLMQQLGEGAYGDYRKRVPMLIPFGPT